jgi:hypothetical protein
MLVRRVFIISAVLVIGVFLGVSRAQWFAWLEHEAKVGRDSVSSDAVDVSIPGKFTWEVPRKSWGYREGEAMLSLHVDWATCPEARARELSNRKLRVRVEALGSPESGRQYDRIVHNWYYQTDDPLAPDARMWMSRSANDAEYGLAAINIYPFEATTITLSVTSPDPVLSVCKPHLRLVGTHDYAVFEHLPLLHLLRDGGIAMTFAAAVGLGMLAWRAEARNRRDT